MNLKKIALSLGSITLVAVAVVGATGAFFQDTETSQNNIFVAGAIDLKVDHTRQIYNGVDCTTCDVVVQSDASNQVVATSGGDDPVPFPHAAEEVTFIHSAWTATVSNPNAEWIWATDPVTINDVQNDVTYTFENTFNWFGPFSGASVDFAVAADNSYRVYLNGTLIHDDPAEKNFSSSEAVTVDLTPYIVQGQNVLRFEVDNHAQPNGSQTSNPAGLLYSLEIDGNCEEDHFRNHCSLFSETDLDDERFFNFNDIKPGDWGRNVISLHVYDNDAYACLIAHEAEDQENSIQEPELPDDDTQGELQNYINLFVWQDTNADGEYDAGENPLGPQHNLGTTDGLLAAYDSLSGLYLTGTTTEYVGVAWCVGDMTVAPGNIDCDGFNVSNVAQTDSFSASLTAYAEQLRNNGEFTCADVQVPEPMNPPGGQEPPEGPTMDAVFGNGPVPPLGDSFFDITLRLERLPNDQGRMQVLADGSLVGQSGQFNVDSFFDIYYEIDVTPGSQRVDVKMGQTETVPDSFFDIDITIPEASTTNGAVGVAAGLGNVGPTTGTATEFQTEMIAMDLHGLPPIPVEVTPPFPLPLLGDPDFEHLVLANPQNGSTASGFKAIGQGHLVPGDNWAVDSFFDITYRIEN